MFIIWFLVCFIIAFVISVPLTLYIVGSMLPIEHTASHSIEVPSPPDRTFDLIADFKGMKNWPHAGITAIDELPPENGLPVVRQRMGRNSFVLRTTRFTPPREIQRTISDDHQHFGGHWTYIIEPSSTGSKVTLTEVGTVKHAIARAVMKYLTGYDFYLKKHLKALQGAAR